jgi:hypothetical protein
MAGSRGHDVCLPGEPFNLMAELERFRNMRNSVVPENMTSLMDQATEELIESRLADQVVRVGSMAPGFSLPNISGERVTLDQVLSRGPAVVSFYRGVWCPFCNLEQRALPQYPPQINGLTYEVLSDVGSEVADSYALMGSSCSPTPTRTTPTAPISKTSWPPCSRSHE